MYPRRVAVWSRLLEFTIVALRCCIAMTLLHYHFNRLRYRIVWFLYSSAVGIVRAFKWTTRPAGLYCIAFGSNQKKGRRRKREKKKAARTHSTCVVLQWSNEFYSSSTNFSWWQVWMPHAKKFAKSSSVSIQCWSFLRSNQHFYQHF